MRSIGELMKEMGFNKDAPIETQKAFIRHLISAANESTRGRTIQLPETKSAPINSEGQLSFDPDILGVQPKKSASK